MPLILDLRAQLADRAHRARALIEYIQDNGLVGKVSISILCLNDVGYALNPFHRYSYHNLRGDN